MSRFGQTVVLAVASLWIGGCARTTFKSTWMNPTAEAQDLQGKRVAALVVTDDEGRRRTAEDALALELDKKGVRAFAGYQLTQREPTADFDGFRAALQEQHIEAAVVMRVIADRRESRYVPGYLIGGPGYVSPYGNPGYSGWSSAYGSGDLITTTVVSVETVVYSVADGKLVWRGVSQTLDPLRVNVMKTVADNAANEMEKAGLI
jgi:hypothetical protein